MHFAAVIIVHDIHTITGCNARPNQLVEHPAALSPLFSFYCTVNHRSESFLQFRQTPIRVTESQTFKHDETKIITGYHHLHWLSVESRRTGTGPVISRWLPTPEALVGGEGWRMT